MEKRNSTGAELLEDLKDLIRNLPIVSLKNKYGAHYSLQRNIVILWKKYRAFLSSLDILYSQHISSCCLETDLVIGIISRMILLYLFNRERFFHYARIFQESTDRDIFGSLSENLINANLVQKSYLFTGIQLWNFKSGSWFYWFSTPSFKELRSLTDIEEEKIKRIITSSPIKELFQQTFNLTWSELDNHLKRALKNTYLVRMFCPSSSGLVSYNLFIFIRRYDYDEECINQAAIALVFIHEFCHFLRRADCKTMRESKEKYTPIEFKEIIQRSIEVSNFKLEEEEEEQVEEIGEGEKGGGGGGEVRRGEEDVEEIGEDEKVDIETMNKLSVNDSAEFLPKEKRKHCNARNLYLEKNTQTGYTKSKLSKDEEEDIVEEIKRFEKDEEFIKFQQPYRIDAGYELEEALFGSRVVNVNIKASEYLLNEGKYPVRIENFKLRFTELNSIRDGEIHRSLFRGYSSNVCTLEPNR